MKVQSLIFLMAYLFALQSCLLKKEQKTPVRSFVVKQDDFNKLVNSKTLNDDEKPNLSIVKTLFNNDYPIELALFKDGKWYYNLPTLGDGKGTWSFEEGRIKLFAKRKLFDMHIELKATKEGAEQVAIEFIDRFGQKHLTLEGQNINFDSEE